MFQLQLQFRYVDTVFVAVHCKKCFAYLGDTSQESQGNIACFCVLATASEPSQLVWYAHIHVINVRMQINDNKLLNNNVGNKER